MIPCSHGGTHIPGTLDSGSLGRGLHRAGLRPTGRSMRGGCNVLEGGCCILPLDRSGAGGLRCFGSRLSTLCHRVGCFSRVVVVVDVLCLRFLNPPRSTLFHYRRIGAVAAIHLLPVKGSCDNDMVNTI